MRIIYIEAFPGNGGAEEYAFNLATKARDDGHEVCFVLGDATGALVERVRDANFDMLIIPMKSSFNIFEVTKSIFKLKKFLKEYKPDIVHAQMLREQSIVIGAKILGAKTRLVRTFHRLDQFDWKMKPLMLIYRKYTDTFIAISEYMKDYLGENGFKHKVFVVHNGVKQVHVSTKKKALGFLGRISPEKGIKTFVQKNEKLFETVPLIIGGDGPETLVLTNFVQKKNLQIKLLGQITDKDKFFSFFNVLVLPSSTEAVPLVVLEAFSVGTPVVAFDIPSLRTLINGQNGKLVRTGDHKLLAKTALEISQAKNYKQFSENAYETYQHRYTIEKMWFDTERLYQRLCK